MLATPPVIRAKPLLLFDLTDHANHVWAQEIACLMERQPAGYLARYRPFTSNPVDIERILQNATVGLVYRNDRTQSTTVSIACWFLNSWGQSGPEFGLLVDHDHSGQGIGSLCMQMAQIIARWRNATRIRSAVWPDNIGALRINQRFGFVEVGRDDRGRIEMELIL